jgi:valyl-tRNA synthetase
MWYFRYPLEGAPDRFIVVGTTRPRDHAGRHRRPVHPDDERYRALVGKTCILPIVNRPMPIVADEYANPEKGRRGEDHAGP